MKKMYKITSTSNTVFVADARDVCEIRKIGREFLEKEIPIVKVEEVKTLEDLPEGWEGDELVWGTEEGVEPDITPKNWFKSHKKRRSAKELELEIGRLKREIESLKGSDV